VLICKVLVFCCRIFDTEAVELEVVAKCMSYVCESSSLLYTKYINPIYVTAITSPAGAHDSSSRALRTYRPNADWLSQLSSTRSFRRQTEFPYVVRRPGINRHRCGAKNSISGVIKSMGKLKFNDICEATNDLISEPYKTGISQTEVDSSIHVSDSSKPMSSDLEYSASFCDPQGSVLNVGDCNSLAIDESRLNVVVKSLNDFHVTD